MKSDVRIEYMRLGEIIPAKRNAKSHDLGAIHESIERRGFVMPLLVDDETGRLVAGHGRLEALVQQKSQGKQAPARIQVTKDGDWLVPVIRGVGFKSEADAEAYLVADNQTTILGGWDDTLLLNMLKELNTQELLVGTGFDLQDVDQLLRDVEGEKADPNEDTIPAKPKNATAQRGEIWILGEHRLMCGDSTKTEEADLLMRDEKAQMVFTDPPYGIQYQGKGGASVAGDQTYTAIPLMFANLPRALDSLAWLYICGGSVNASLYTGMFERYFKILPKIIVWDKQAMTMSRHGYHSAFELIYVGYTKGAGYVWHGSRAGEAAQDLWRIPRPGRDRTHLTEKPVELARRAITNSSQKGAIVYDPFSGSGSTIIACEKTGRRARAMEIEPKYVDVAVKRWEQMTGKKATRDRGSRDAIDQA